MLGSFDLSSARTEEPPGGASLKGMPRLPVSLHPSIPCVVSGLSDQRRLLLTFLLQHRAHVIDESWSIAFPVASVVKHRKDARVCAEVDPCHGH